MGNMVRGPISIKILKFCKKVRLLKFNRISPVGVFFLVTAKLLEIGSFSEVVGQLGWYFVTVMLGLFLHGFGKKIIFYYFSTPYKPL